MYRDDWRTTPRVGLGVRRGDRRLGLSVAAEDDEAEALAFCSTDSVSAEDEGEAGGDGEAILGIVG